jgi:hypothetical protein
MSSTLKRRVNFKVYQATHGNDLFKTLDGRKDDIIVYDKCGRLAYHIPFPKSYIRYRFVEAAILSAYLDNPCGPCSSPDSTRNVTISDGDLDTEKEPRVYEGSGDEEEFDTVTKKPKPRKRNQTNNKANSKKHHNKLRWRPDDSEEPHDGHHHMANVPKTARKERNRTIKDKDKQTGLFDVNIPPSEPKKSTHITSDQKS